MIGEESAELDHAFKTCQPQVHIRDDDRPAMLAVVQTGSDYEPLPSLLQRNREVDVGDLFQGYPAEDGISV